MREAIEIVEQHGSHRLVRSARGFAILERRGGKVYAVKDGERQGFPETADGIAAAVARCWTDEATARRRFAEIAGEGERFAQRIW